MKFLLSILSHPHFSFYATVFILLLAVIAFEYRKQAKFFNKFNQGSKPLTGPFQLPLLGNLYQVAKPSRFNMLKKYVILYQIWCHLGAGRIWIGDRLFIFVFFPEYLEIILGDVKKVQKPAEYYILRESPLGGGLISQGDANLWRAHRKIITPTFHFNVLKTYIPVFYDEACILLKKIEDQFGKCGSKEIFVPNLHTLITLSAFDMILRNAFGVRIHAQENENHSFVNAMVEATQIIQDRIAMPWLLLNPFFSLLGYETRQEQAKKICYEFTESVIRSKRLEHKKKQQQLANDLLSDHKDSNNVTSDTSNQVAGNGSNENSSNVDYSLGYANSDNKVRDGMNVTDTLTYATHKSFLELIIENEANEELKMNDEEIRDHMITIMFAGQDTTATTISVALLLLAIHPEIQAKVLEEIDSVFGGVSEDDGHVPTYAELMELSTLDRTIKEATRLYPAAPIFGRALTEDTPVGPFVLPKGSTVIFFIFGLHRDPRFHDKPNEFWPDRFLPENSRHTHNFAFIPFGAGSRNCVGQKYAMLQMKTVLSTILRKFSVTTEQSIRSVADIDDLVNVDMTLSVKRCPVVLSKRK